MKKQTLLLLMTLSLTTVTAQGPNDSGNYYALADGKHGASLKTALCNIIYNRTERTYSELWEDFMSTDVRSDGKIWDMYSCITNYEPVTKGSNYKIEGDCYNREHSFPNSWFGKKIQPMYTDLHHLYPTDGYVNNKRGNYPFGETDGEKYMSAGNFSKLGACTYSGYTGMVFEPADEYKGDFARTYFYMVTCYEEQIADWYTNFPDSRPTLDGNAYPGLSKWQLEMLMNWAQRDPVSKKEHDRNIAVGKIQGNRNPFIDYPGLEEYIWGKLTNEPFDYDNYPTLIIFDDPTAIKRVEPSIGVSVQDGALCITSDTDTLLSLFNIDGTVRRRLKISKGMNYIQGLHHGIYIINHKKVVVR